ncbi:MAG: DALR anticodon-binding domain-containing protein [Planctomycetota bacterium]|nr:DALR anticodon-binding domain-containing protein [Planctomycetota bacterium]
MDKFERGFDSLVVLLGPDHHAHTLTMHSALRALDLPAEELHYILVQHCTLFKGSEPLKMSTRKGTFVTLGEVMDSVGRDAARLFFLYRSVDSHLDFDLELAVKEAPDNPVFYLQYASARCASILRRAQQQGLIAKDELSDEFFNFSSLSLDYEQEEQELLRYLGRFPVAIERAANSLDQMKLINYLNEIVERFHNYYHRKKVIVEDRDAARPRLAVISSFRQVLVNGLELLGISAPTSM